MSSSTFPLNELNLSPQQLDACTKAGFINAADILLPSAAELNRKLKLPRLEAVIDLIKTVSRAIVPLALPPTTGRPLDHDQRDVEQGHTNDAGGASGPALHRGRWIGTGDAGLDALLGGGLQVGTITEITGESAAGKSHWCLALALAAQLPSVTTTPGASMILTSEREIATDRMIELAHHMLALHDPSGSLRRRPRDMLDNVLSNIVQDVTILEHTLTYKVPLILRSRLGLTSNALLGQPDLEPTQIDDDAGDGGLLDTTTPALLGRPGGPGMPIRLLIVDSITALIRGADSSYANSTSIGLTERSRRLCAVADRLKSLAVEFGLAVVVINQVSDVFNRNEANGMSNGNGYGNGSTFNLPAGAVASSQPSASPLLSQFYVEGPEPPMLYATQSRHFSGQTDQLKKEASLGIVWANAINTRIMLSRTGRRRMVDPKDLSTRRRRRGAAQEPREQLDGDGATTATSATPAVVDDDAATPTLIRKAHVVFSSCAPPATIDYVITKTGIHSMPDSYRLIDIAETLRRRDKMAKAILYGDGASPEREVVSYQRTSVESSATNGPRATWAEHRGDDDAGPDVGPDEDDPFDEEVFDDLGDLPLEFWEGRMDQVHIETLAHGEGV